MKEWKVGYISSYNLSSSTYIGGFMITDNFGIPLEFRYTEPIKPTKIQKILYGQALEKYIKKEVIFLNLLSNSTTKPDLLITSEDDLLEFQEVASCPLLSLKETSLSPLAEVGVRQEINKTEFVLQVSPSGSPLRINMLDTNAENRKKIENVILELETTMNLLEPITRVEGALKVICQENEA